MIDYLQRTWAEIDLDRIDQNFQNIKARVQKGAKICCIVKADAYGHGAPVIAREYDRLGADWFAVSNIEEAIQLRRSGITEKPILILGYTPPQLARELADNRLSQTVLSLSYARELSEQAVLCGKIIKIHIKVDTGMSRIGFVYQSLNRSDRVLDDMAAASRMPGLFPEGIFTHFSVADEGKAGETFTYRQFTCFQSAIAGLKERNIHFQLHHCANSGALIDYPEFHLDMVRPGIILYGLMPSEQTEKSLPLEPAMELKTVISLVKEVEPGTSVSYGRTYTTEKPTRIATVPIGYADGYPRRFSGKAYMLVRGRRVPVIGRICMDQLMLDVSDVSDVQEGDIVTVFGHDHALFLPVEELAHENDTINYEMVCLVGKRVPRIYKRDGEFVDSLNYICPQP